MVQQMGDQDFVFGTLPIRGATIKPPVYPSGQKCKHCPAILSQYNPRDVCNTCIERQLAVELKCEIERETKTSVRDRTFLKLKVKKRKPVTQRKVIE